MSLNLENVAGPVHTPASWSPSPGLRRQLLLGALGVLAAAGLATATTLTVSGPDQGPVFPLACGLAWAILPALFLVLRAYLALARDTRSPGLKWSARGLFGVIVLGLTLQLAVVGGIPGGQHVVVWGVEVLGAHAVLLIACGVMVLLWLLMGVFTLWFGLAKIRLRRQLGEAATLLGWAEVAGPVIAVGAFLCFLGLALSPAHPSMVEASLDNAANLLVTLALVGDLVWACLTALLFLTVRQGLPQRAGC